MINLLPPDSKETLVFARRNTILIRYVVGLSIGALGILVVIGLGMLYLQQETNSYKDSIAETKAELTQQKETETVAKVQGISNSLNLVVSVLEQEILFSKLLKQIGAAMPSGTVLQDLSLSNELTGAVSLEAGAVSRQAASQVQVNLQDKSNNIFDEADLENIQCKPIDPAKPDPYPCKATLRALFSKESDFTLLGKEDKNE